MIVLLLTVSPSLAAGRPTTPGFRARIEADWAAQEQRLGRSCTSAEALAARLRGLDDLLRRVPEKYGSVSYSSYDLVHALVYFVDVEGDETPHMLVPFDWDDVKEFFEEEALRLIQ